MRVRLAARSLLPALACIALSAASAFAQGTADPARSRPVRGVWVHPGFFGTERTAAIEKMRATLDAYAEAGINTVIVLVKTTSGHVYYATGIGVPDPAWNWDFFGTFLAEARQRKAEVVDTLCPMLYTNSAGLFEKLVVEALAHSRGHSQVCAGIGIGTSHNQNTADGMAEQMRIAASSGADGVVFFSSSSLNAPFLERLKSAK